jgi:hypothetical protein
MFPYYQKDDRTERERYLEDELERERDAQRERDRIEDERREARHRELEETWRYEERQVDTWPEAFRKAVRLFSREIDPEFEKTDGDFYFTDSADACRMASELWDERSDAHAEEIKELNARLQKIQDQIREEVADLLETKAPVHGDKPSFGFRGIAQSIRDDSISSILDW